jgi:hypothetical protein
VSETKIPFGFRQDVEPEPEAEEHPEAARREISVTFATTERAWTPNFRVPAQARARGGAE